MWTVLTIVAIGFLIIYWGGRNAVWGGATLGFVVGLVVAVIALLSQEGFKFLIVGKGFVIGALIGTVCELIVTFIKWLDSKIS